MRDDVKRDKIHNDDYPNGIEVSSVGESQGVVGWGREDIGLSSSTQSALFTPHSATVADEGSSYYYYKPWHWLLLQLFFKIFVSNFIFNLLKLACINQSSP